MRPIKIDVVTLQPFQAGLHRRNHGLAAVAGGENAAVRIAAQGELGSDHEIIAPALQQAAEQFLRFAELIAVGCVDEVAARFGVALEDAACLRRLRAVPPPGPEIPRAEHEFGYAKAGASSKQLVA